MHSKVYLNIHYGELPFILRILHLKLFQIVWFQRKCGWCNSYSDRIIWCTVQWMFQSRLGLFAWLLPIQTYLRNYIDNIDYLLDLDTLGQQSRLAILLRYMHVFHVWWIDDIYVTCGDSKCIWTQKRRWSVRIHVCFFWSGSDFRTILRWDLLRRSWIRWHALYMPCYLINCWTCSDDL